MSAVSFYYYLQVLKQIYIVEPESETKAVPAPVVSLVAIVLLALAVVILGVAPNLLLGPLLGAIQGAGR
jgi:NADH-quinone oxidoreductase subunit N